MSADDVGDLLEGPRARSVISYFSPSDLLAAFVLRDVLRGCCLVSNTLNHQIEQLEAYGLGQVAGVELPPLRRGRGLMSIPRSSLCSQCARSAGSAPLFRAAFSDGFSSGELTQAFTCVTQRKLDRRRRRQRRWDIDRNEVHETSSGAKVKSYIQAGHNDSGCHYRYEL